MIKLRFFASLGPFIALVLACVFFAAQSDRFLSLQNFALILQQVMGVGTLAIGRTLVIITAGIDLSCVVVMALDGTTMTKLAVKSGLDPCLAIACGVAACMAFGLVKGLLVTRGKPPPFIVSLSTMKIAFVMTQLYSGAQTVTGLPPAKVFLATRFNRPRRPSITARCSCSR